MAELNTIESISIANVRVRQNSPIPIQLCRFDASCMPVSGRAHSHKGHPLKMGPLERKRKETRQALRMRTESLVKCDGLRVSVKLKIDRQRNWQIAENEKTIFFHHNKRMLITMLQF